MKKVLTSVAVIFALFVIISSTFLIIEMIAVKNAKIYDLPKLYNNYDIDSLESVIPGITVTYSDEHDKYVANTRKGESNELIFISEKGSKKIYNIIYYSDIPCGAEYEMDSNSLHKIGILSNLPSLMESTYVPKTEHSGNIFSIHYQSLLNDDLVSMNCILEDEMDSSEIHFEIISIGNFAKDMGISESDVWPEIKKLRY